MFRLSREELTRLRKALGDDVVGYASAEEDEWTCACGTKNHFDPKQEVQNCIRCHRNRDFVLKRYSAPTDGVSSGTHGTTPTEESDSLIDARAERSGPQAGSQVSTHLRAGSGALFALAILAFLAPFATASCQGAMTISVTGMDLATGTTTTTAMGRTQRLDPEPLASVALAAAAFGLLITLIASKPALPMLAGLTGFGCLLALMAKTTSEFQAQRPPGVTLEWNHGFWGALLLLLGAAVLNGGALLSAKQASTPPATARTTSNDPSTREVGQNGMRFTCPYCQQSVLAPHSHGEARCPECGKASLVQGTS